MSGTPDRWIVIPNWEKFQHPDAGRTDHTPWIKNLTRLLHNHAYMSLTQSQRGILHGLWILYASTRRDLNEALAKHLLVTNKAESRHWRSNLESLNHAGFIAFSASSLQARCKQPASTEIEIELDTLP